VRSPGKAHQHRRGVALVARLAQYVAIEDDDGVTADHDGVRR